MEFSQTDPFEWAADQVYEYTSFSASTDDPGQLRHEIDGHALLDLQIPRDDFGTHEFGTRHRKIPKITGYQEYGSPDQCRCHVDLPFNGCGSNPRRFPTKSRSKMIIIDLTPTPQIQQLPTPPSSRGRNRERETRPDLSEA
ncbi:hypothetical protein RUND412_009945 [Rhizina undulata]